MSIFSRATGYVTEAQETSFNPQGLTTSYNPDESYATKKVLRGGSFLCNETYYTGYRVSARMKSTAIPAWLRYRQFFTVL